MLRAAKALKLAIDHDGHTVTQRLALLHTETQMCTGLSIQSLRLGRYNRGQNYLRKQASHPFTVRVF